jgi:transcriptional regulator with XRE-family HTH domain
LRRRHTLKLLQRQVAEKLSVEKSSIANWEANRTKPTLAYMPASVFLFVAPTSVLPAVARYHVSGVGMSDERLTEKPPLTEEELGRLADFLEECKDGNAMNIEELDGFFAALIAGPETVPPSEYLPEVFGGELSKTCDFADVDEANEILGLILRH